MDQKLTREGARSVTMTVDRIASLVQDHHGVLGIPADVALDYAKRSDLISDAIETRAVQNTPLPREAAEVDQVPAQDDDPDVSGVTEESGGNTDEDPESDDQNKPETYYDGGSAKVAEGDELLRKLLAEEGMSMPKEAAHDWPLGPAKNETGDSIEPGGSAPPHWDANAIADDRGGPLQQEPDEPYMAGEFAQKQYHELRDKQQSGQVNQTVDKFAFLDAHLGDDLEPITADALEKLGSEYRQVIAEVADLGSMPGLSSQQTRALANRVAEIRQEVEVIVASFDEATKTALARISDLEKEEKKGLGEIKRAAGYMRQEGKFLLETEQALLQFTAYLNDKRPGIAQMIAREGEVKPGEKAGDFFGRISTELGEDIAARVAAIHEATRDDLSYARM
jgi:hypothetical protein